MSNCCRTRRACILAEPASERGVVEDRNDGSLERNGVCGGNEKTVFAVVDQAPKAFHVGGDAGDGVSQGLREHPARLASTAGWQ